MCGYELPTNLQNFTQKDFTEMKIFQKLLGGGATFYSETPCMCCILAETKLDVGETVAEFWLQPLVPTDKQQPEYRSSHLNVHFKLSTSLSQS